MAARTDKAVSLASEVIRASGGRMTGARRAVIAALAAGKDHVTAEDLVRRVQSASPEVHRSSVYRTLETLTKSGVIRHVHVNSGGTAYHLSATAAEPHLHAQCQECSVVVDLPGDLLAIVCETVEQATGFRLDPSHVALSGTCASCLRKAREVHRH